MAHTVARWLAVPFMLAIWIFSVIGIALTASLIDHYGDNPAWPGDLGGWTRSGLALFVFTTVLSTIFLIGVIIGMPLLMSTLLNVVVWTIFWVWLLTNSIGYQAANDANDCDLTTRGDRCAMFRTAEAFMWMTCWTVFLWLIVAALAQFVDRFRSDRSYGGGSSGAVYGGGGSGAVYNAPAPGATTGTATTQTVPPMHATHQHPMSQPASAPRATV